ncbi:hypothetical protein [Tsuneonella sp. HG222]
MSVLGDVRAPIDRLVPEPICGECIAKRLGLSVRQHANHKTRELAGVVASSSAKTFACSVTARSW